LRNDATSSGQYNNYFRTYDPTIGRYTQSDPIGLAGGLNTYSYVGTNPNRFTDPTGLLVGQVATWVARPALAGLGRYAGRQLAQMVYAEALAPATSSDSDDKVVPLFPPESDVVESCDVEEPSGPDECEILLGELDRQWVKITQERSSGPPRGMDPFTHQLNIRRMIARYRLLAKRYNAMCVPKGFPYRDPNIFGM